LRGVGPKTAAAWLLKYGSLEAIFAHSGELKPARFQSLVHAERDNLRRNLQMTTLDYACRPEPEDLDNTPTPNPPEIFRILEILEMKTALRDARKRYPEN
jgi:DNA polymerase I